MEEDTVLTSDIRYRSIKNESDKLKVSRIR